MIIRIILCPVLLLAFACSSDGPRLERSPSPTDRPAVRSPSPVPSPTTEEETVLGIEGVAGPPGGSDAAGRLRAEAGCGPGSEPIVRLSWRPATEAGRSQLVVVTQFANGFETGAYEASPRLPADNSRLDWTDTAPNGAYSWRVLTRHGGDWVPSKVSSFIGPSCGVADMG